MNNKFFDFDNRILLAAESAEKNCAADFERINDITEYNQQRDLRPRYGVYEHDTARRH